MKRLLCVGMLLAGVATVSAQEKAANQELRALSVQEVPLVLKTLAKLVSIESGSRDLAGLLTIRQAIEGELKTLGIPYEVVTTPAADKTGAMIQASLKGKGVARIALIAHMDTVYQQGDAAKQPFRIEGDKAYGLGIADDRAGIAMILHTLRMLSTLKFDSFGEITVLINADEEIGSPSSRQRLIQLGRDNDLVISFEGSGAKSDYVRLATSSIARANLSVRGRAAHAGANPEFGRNALVELSHQILQLSDLSDPARGLKLNWTLARAGTVLNMIPPEAHATADIRAQQEGDFDEVERVLQERIKNKRVPDTQVSVEVVRGRPPLNPTEKSRGVARQAQAIGQEIGWKMDVLEKATGGGTDAAYASLEAKGAVIESFGLQGFGAHTDDAEYILIPSIQPRLYITTRLIEDISR